MQVDSSVAPIGAAEAPAGASSRETPPWSTRVIAVPLSASGEAGVAAACAFASIAIRFGLDPWLAHLHVYTIAFAATAVAALMGGWRAGLACALLAQLGSNLLFVEPRGTLSFTGDDAAQTVTFYLMAAVLLCVTHIAVQAHRALRLLVLRLRSADQAKTDLLATIAHELRNPVSAMRLATHRIEIDDQPAGRRKAAGVLERQLAHVSRLVDDLTDASRIHNGKISLHVARHRVSDLIGRAAELVEPSLRQRRQSLRLHGDEQADIRADGARIVQVLANVLHNASKYSPDGTAIHVHVEAGPRRACIRVVDQGVGIPHDKLEWVFDCYAQVKQGNDGLGLGLSLVRRLVELHGGTITALSRGTGEGSTFEVCLPRLPAGGGPD